MKLGILSDSHNHTGHLARALTLCRQAGIEEIVHCGDLTDMGLAEQFRGFTVHYVTGNVDSNPYAIRRALQELSPANTFGLTFAGIVGGVPVAATHGHLKNEWRALLRDAQYRYIFHGHTHKRRDEPHGSARIINPGALGGARHEPRSFCILDLASGEAEFVTVADW